MAWTKRQLIDEAFGVLALQGFRVNLDADQRQGALRKLDSMIGMWNGLGIRLGYPLTSNPDDSDIDSDSGIPDWANLAVYMKLSVLMASGYGKALSPETLAMAKAAYNVLLSRAASADVQQQQLPDTMPRGAGSKPWRWHNGPFMPTPTDTIDAGSDGPIDFT